MASIAYPTATAADSTAAGTITTVTVTAPAETASDSAPDALTTTLPILAIPFPEPNILDDLVGSISAIDDTNNETTIVLDCAETVSSCVPSLIPLTITTGPSSFIYTWSWDGPGWGSIPSSVTVDATETVLCAIVGTQTIGCETTYATAYSGSGGPTSGETWFVSVYGTEGFEYQAVPITGGLDLLGITSAAATATATGDSAGETAGSGSGSDTLGETDSNSDSGSGSGSSSKAWIAGPVIGGLVGIALIIGLIFFLRRRRQRRAAAADAATPIAELPEKGVHKGELPAREPAAAELSTVKGQNQVHEMP
ncbi:hypothetical protein BJY00DRAFT_282599 [Aspergillus carlsbadensis]|nr:hypothetical protein BJY00DRAFT_282599 [Aspergillus carlsbadensis]